MGGREPLGIGCAEGCNYLPLRRLLSEGGEPETGDSPRWYFLTMGDGVDVPAEADVAETAEVVETSTPAAPLGIEVDILPRASYAMAHNRLATIRTIRVQNLGCTPGGPLTIKVTSTWAASDVAPLRGEPIVVECPLRGDWVEVDGGNFRLDDTALVMLEEAAPATVTISVTDPDGRSTSENCDITILARNQWTKDLPIVTAAFVQPNHPAVSQVLAKAADYLERDTGSRALQGYQAGPHRVRQIAASVFEALKEFVPTYINPPASFDEEGQKVRPLDQVLEEQQGTCIDLSCAYASVMQQTGINSVILLVHGHAFPAFFTEEEPPWGEGELPDDVVTSMSSILAFTDSGWLIPVESTGIPGPGTFDEAVASAELHLAEEPAICGVCTDKKMQGVPAQTFPHLIAAVDVRRAFLRAGIRPIPARVRNGEIIIGESVAAHPICGRKIVIAGTLSSMELTEVQAAIEAVGGTATKFVSYFTDVLVVGSEPGGKVARAENLGLEIWDEETLVQALKTPVRRAIPRAVKRWPKTAAQIETPTEDEVSAEETNQFDPADVDPTWTALVLEAGGSVEDVFRLQESGVSPHFAAVVIGSGGSADDAIRGSLAISGVANLRSAGSLLGKGCSVDDVLLLYAAAGNLQPITQFIRSGGSTPQALQLVEQSVPFFGATETLLAGGSIQDAVDRHRSGVDLPGIAEFLRVGGSVDDAILLETAGRRLGLDDGSGGAAWVAKSFSILKGAALLLDAGATVRTIATLIVMGLDISHKSAATVAANARRAVSTDTELVESFLICERLERVTRSLNRGIPVLQVLDPKVRQALDPSTPAEVLSDLRRDSSRRVRAALILRPDVDSFSTFAKDEDPFVRRVVAIAPQCLESVLLQLSLDDDMSVRTALLLNPSVTETVRAQAGLLGVALTSADLI